MKYVLDILIGVISVVLIIACGIAIVALVIFSFSVIVSILKWFFIVIIIITSIVTLGMFGKYVRKEYKLKFNKSHE